MPSFGSSESKISYRTKLGGCGIRFCKFPLTVTPRLDPVGVNLSRRGVGTVTLFAGDVPCDILVVRVGTLRIGLNRDFLTRRACTDASSLVKFDNIVIYPYAVIGRQLDRLHCAQ